MQRIRLPRILLLAAALPALVSCGDAASDPAAAVVRFDPGPCAVELPAGQLPERTICGTVTVPESRPFDGRTLELAVVVLRATGPDPAPDPVVVLSGGPGDGALDRILRNWSAYYAAPLQERRDVVFFDQRGTGRSRPFLGCPEYVAVTGANLTENLSLREAARREVAALRACHDRLVTEGIDPAAYTSAASAADSRDVLRALGYETWNLRGISYGARVALTALRDVPDGIRSVILDSPVPPQADFDADFGASFERALNALYAACARDGACAAAYPDLAGALAAVVQRLNGSPLVLMPVDPATGVRTPLVVSGDRLLLGLQQAMYATDLIPALPFAIAQLAAGDTSLLEQVAADLTARSASVSWGVRYSVGCAEETRFVTPEGLAAAARGVDPHLVDIGHAAIVEPTLAACDFWRSRVLGAIENQPVQSATPALVLSGELDRVTPPRYGVLAASGLETAYRFELPGFGHGVLPVRGPEGDRPDCAFGIIARFLEDPSAAPDASCIDRLPPIRFAGT